MPIPLGWALDTDGNPTTDPKRALAGSMLPMGGMKGAMLALIVEVLVHRADRRAIGFEANTFFVDAGNRPRFGQAFLVVDPDALAGHEVFVERVETLVTPCWTTRRCGCRGRDARKLAETAEREGVAIPGRAGRATTSAGGVRRLNRHRGNRIPDHASAAIRRMRRLVREPGDRRIIDLFSRGRPPATNAQTAS